MKLSPAQSKLLKKLQDAPLESSRDFFCWSQTFIVDVSESGRGYIHTFPSKRKSSLLKLEELGIIEIFINPSGSKWTPIDTAYVKLTNSGCNNIGA